MRKNNSYLKIPCHVKGCKEMAMVYFNNVYYCSKHGLEHQKERDSYDYNTRRTYANGRCSSIRYE